MKEFEVGLTLSQLFLAFNKLGIHHFHSYVSYKFLKFISK